MATDIKSKEADIKSKEAKFHDDRLSSGSDRDQQAKFYWAVQPYHDRFKREVEAKALDRDILELGCFAGERTVELARVARSIVGIDISPVAVDLTRKRALDLRLGNVAAEVCDAETLTFKDGAFDLVFAEGVIHHVNVEKTVDEIFRVLRPGGIALFREPLGQNPMINLYRAWTPGVRTEDERPLVQADLDFMAARFDRMTATYFGFFSLAAAPFQASAIGSVARSALNMLDGALFDNALLGRFCWQANIALYRAA